MGDNVKKERNEKEFGDSLKEIWDTKTYKEKKTRGVKRIAI